MFPNLPRDEIVSRGGTTQTKEKCDRYEIRNKTNTKVIVFKGIMSFRKYLSGILGKDLRGY